MEDLYLPPRSRKTLQQINQSESDGSLKYFIFSSTLNSYFSEGRGKKRKKVEEDSGSGSDDGGGSDDDRPKKRGRPRSSAKESIKGFSDAEVIVNKFQDDKLYKFFAIGSPFCQELQKIFCTSEKTRSCCV